MGWHESYLVQARSDYEVWKKLQDRERFGEVAQCHQLHYLVMAMEKLAKGMLTRSGDEQPAPASHAVLVPMLYALNKRPELRRRLGYRKADIFRSYVKSLLPVAYEIQRTSPDQAGFTRPNPEYPWRDAATGRVWAPAEYAFTQFGPGEPKMDKMKKLVDQLMLWLT